VVVVAVVVVVVMFMTMIFTLCTGVYLPVLSPTVLQASLDVT
jgi:hypothetical protein